MDNNIKKVKCSFGKVLGKLLKQGKNLLILFFAIILISSSTSVMASSNSASNAGNKNEEVKFNFDVEKLRGTEVTFYGWGGSEKTNGWIDGYLSKVMMEKYGIKLKRVGMGIDEILSQLIAEKEASSKKGTIDVVWINGENFYTAKNKGLLYGRIDSFIPNYKKYIDSNNTENTEDFNTSVEGMEIPYGRAQLVLIMDGEILKTPINSTKELLEVAKNNPGIITYPAPPDFTGSAFVRNILCDIVGYENILKAGNDEGKLREVLKPGFDYLKEIKPYLWKEGKTYPVDSTQQNNLFSDGEVSFNLTYHPYSLLSEKATGHFPKTSFSSLFSKGTIGNTHFVSMAFNSPNPEGAMVLINEIISVEAQASKYDPKVWGDLPILSNEKLSKEEKELFSKVDLGEGAISQEELLSKRIPELPVDVLLLIEKIWLEEIPVE